MRKCSEFFLKVVVSQSKLKDNTEFSITSKFIRKRMQPTLSCDYAARVRGKIQYG